MLVALEQQLQNQNGPSASASDSSSANPGQITVKVPRERKLGKFAGSRDDGILEEWIGDATRAIAGQTDADGMDFLPYHLDSVAKEEVRLHPAEKRAIPATVFKVPRDCFSEGLTNTQASWKFFKKRQRDYESVCEFSHAFMLRLPWLEHLDAAVVKDKLLRDQFLENLADPQLRRDIECCVDTTPPKPSKRSEMRFSAGLTGTDPPPPHKKVCCAWGHNRKPPSQGYLWWGEGSCWPAESDKWAGSGTEDPGKADSMSAGRPREAATGHLPALHG